MEDLKEIGRIFIKQNVPQTSQFLQDVFVPHPLAVPLWRLTGEAEVSALLARTQLMWISVDGTRNSSQKDFESLG